MNNSISSIIFLVIALVLGMFLTQSIVEDSNLVLAIALGGGVGLMFFWRWMAPALSFDAWILLVVCTLYIISGKGFAYWNVGGLIFPGEVVLALCGIAYLGRVANGTHALLPPTIIVIPLCGMLFLGFVRIAISDWGRFGVLALRDFCVIYYSLIAFVSYQLTVTQPAFAPALKKTLVVYGFIAVLLESVWSYSPAFNAALQTFRFGQFNFLLPHGDACHGVWFSFILYGAFYENASSSSRVAIWRFLSAFSFTYLIALGRGAGYVGLMVVFAVLIPSGRLGLFIRRTGPLSALLVVIAYFGFWAVKGEDVIGERVVSEFKSMMILERKQVVTEDDGNADWRLQWWGYIYRNVSRDSPIFGWGFGKDISTEFHQWYLRTSDVGANWGRVRGAHNVIFTILARMGFTGVLLLLWVVAAQVHYFKLACSFIRERNFPQDIWLLLGFLCFEFAVSFLQYAWEAPYSAIPFWIAAGSFYARIEMLKFSGRTTRSTGISEVTGNLPRPARLGSV